MESPNEELLMLSEIYHIFEGKEISNKEKARQVETENVVEEADKVFNIENIPVLFVNEATETSVVDIQEFESDNLFKVQPGSSTSNFEEEKFSHNLNVREGIINQRESSPLNNQKETLDKQELPLSHSVLNTSLDNYFVWSQTPERQGKRQTEKLPFVLTSTVRKKAEQAKFEKKKLEIDLKEKRKEERLQKKDVNKAKGKSLKAKTIIKKSLRKMSGFNDTANDKESVDIKSRIVGTNKVNINSAIPPVLPPKNPEIKNISPVLTTNPAMPNLQNSVQGIEYITSKKGLKLHLPQRKPEVFTCFYNNLESSLNVTSPLCKVGDPSTTKENETFLTPIFPINNNFSSPENSIFVPETTKRKLFIKEEPSQCSKIKIISNITVKPEPEFSNVYVNTNNICYECLLNITLNKMGLRCLKCTRTFHSACAIKYCDPKENTYFVCQKCQEQ